MTPGSEGLFALQMCCIRRQRRQRSLAAAGRLDICAIKTCATIAGYAPALERSIGEREQRRKRSRIEVAVASAKCGLLTGLCVPYAIDHV
jgi:hypothetical protein